MMMSSDVGSVRVVRTFSAIKRLITTVIKLAIKLTIKLKT